MSNTVLRLPGGDAALRRSLAGLERRLPALVSILLLLSIAWLLARLTWELLPAPHAAIPIYSQRAPAAAHSFDVNKLVGQHLFGTAETPGGHSENNAPETTLNLTLSGIAAGPNQPISRAIIISNGKQETYGVGAQLPGGAVIKEILPDQVLLSLNGHVESLRLPKMTGDQGSAVSTPLGAPSLNPRRSAQISSSPAAPQPANLGELRQQVMQHPERLLDVIRAMPYTTNGKFQGYRVFPAGNPHLFEQMGLKPGDIVTAVNGISLDNPADSMRILSKLKTSDQVSVTFTRNGQQQTEVLQMQDSSH